MKPQTLIAMLSGLTFGTFASAESLRVTIEPIAAVEIGAKWRVEGEAKWRPSGDVIDGLKPGVLRVELLTGLDGCGPVSQFNDVRVLLNETTHARLAYDGAKCALKR